ncbi:hypothetical protein Acsp04_36100 [Actinomadura sp. NBRC 104425]|nr:hypothetical protein Acsp04_36100 [Actinomadura sp. NBRC 104425]
MVLPDEPSEPPQALSRGADSPASPAAARNVRRERGAVPIGVLLGSGWVGFAVWCDGRVGTDEPGDSPPPVFETFRKSAVGVVAVEL